MFTLEGEGEGEGEGESNHERESDLAANGQKGKRLDTRNSVKYRLEGHSHALQGPVPGRVVQYCRCWTLLPVIVVSRVYLKTYKITSGARLQSLTSNKFRNCKIEKVNVSIRRVFRATSRGLPQLVPPIKLL